jgi:hypothetical protein
MGASAVEHADDDTALSPLAPLFAAKGADRFPLQRSKEKASQA